MNTQEKAIQVLLNSLHQTGFDDAYLNKIVSDILTDLKDAGLVIEQDWQPIAAEDKEGVCRIMASGSWITTGAWHRQNHYWVQNADGYPRYRSEDQPTHFKPLPDLPTIPEKDAP